MIQNMNHQLTKELEYIKMFQSQIQKIKNHTERRAGQTSVRTEFENWKTMMPPWTNYSDTLKTRENEKLIQ